MRPSATEISAHVSTDLDGRARNATDDGLLAVSETPSQSKGCYPRAAVVRDFYDVRRRASQLAEVGSDDEVVEDAAGGRARRYAV